jgi:hypothetical protein
MAFNFDLNLLPILRQNGQEQTIFPGLYAVTPPKRTGRGRERDKLILFLTFANTVDVPADTTQQLLTRMAQTFYKTSGTVTSALRVLAELANQILLERNLRNPKQQAVGYLTQMVIRQQQVFLAQSGAGHAFVMTPSETQDLFDADNAGRGLGVGRSTALRYFQFTLQPDAFVLLSHQSAETWPAETLRVTANQGLESLRRRLVLGRSEADLAAVLVQVQEGEGKLRFLRLKSALHDMAQPAGESQIAVDQHEKDLSPQLEPAASEAVMPETPDGVREAIEESRAASPAPQAADRQPIRKPAQAADVPVEKSARAVSGQPVLGKKAQKSPSILKRSSAQVLRALAVIQRAFASTLRVVFGWLFNLLRRMLPDEAMLNLNPQTLLFIAIAAPLVVGVVGGMVYIERGQSRQYQAYIDQAFEAATQATTKSDPIEQRAAWQKALELVNQAEIYRLTSDSQALREQVQAALDGLDGIERLDYQTALIGSLDKTVRITRLAVNGGDLYMLNSTQGNVIRAVLTGGGYQIDTQFNCGPVAGGSITVGPLVDIVALPKGEQEGATVMGMDVNGAMTLCIPGDIPLLAQATPPGINFGGVRAYELSGGDLYVLDPGTNAVWIYRSRDTGNPPRLFFSDEVPYMQDVVDLTVYGDDLYLLHADGHQTLCNYGLINSPTRCEDPFNYTDLRQGRSGGPVIPDALFTQIEFSPPPDPSLYLLEPKTQALYHFSLRLAFQRQYRPARPLPDEAVTAFTISSSRLAFLALGNQVYYAALP